MNFGKLAGAKKPPRKTKKQNPSRMKLSCSLEKQTRALFNFGTTKRLGAMISSNSRPKHKPQDK